MFFRRKKDNQPKHEFYEISKRARAAYVILCLEELLQFYEQNFLEWKPILKDFWSITSITEFEIEEWIWGALDCMPESILQWSSFEETIQRRKSAEFWYVHTKEYYDYMKALYQRMEKGIWVVNDICSCFRAIIAEEFWGNMLAHSPENFKHLDRVKEIMLEHQISLPNNKAALEFIFNQKHEYFGPPFDGIQFSALNSKIN